MAAAVSAVSAAGPSSSQAKNVELVHNNIMGHLELSPAYVSYFVEIECKDKSASETYRDYCERVRGSPIRDEQWKKWCNFSWEKLQKDKDPKNMDITAFGHLFHTLFTAKRDTRDTRQFMKQLQNLKNLRNKVMHSKLIAKDPGVIGELYAALQAFVKEAGAFYALPLAEVRDLLKKLKDDMKAGFSPGDNEELYACSYTLEEGWETMEKFYEFHFTMQNLLFDIGKVQRSEVFYPSEVLMGGDEEMKPVSFWEMFEQGEKITIVCGEAGTGKSTLLENIALQFIEPQPDISRRLQDFQLIVYVQCRDPHCKSLKDVIQQQFYNVCTKLGVNDVVKAVLKLRTLFLIDGFDEYQQSMTVVQDVINEVWRANCKVIISTRPLAAKQLRNMLSRSGVRFSEFEMAPLVTLEKQLNFLSKYEPHLPRIQSKGTLLECFKSVPEPIRSLFSEPIKLLQFCSVFEKTPGRIKNWETISDVTEDIFLIYRTLVEKKLSEVRYPNFNVVINDIFRVICRVAFDFTRSNIFTFTDAQFKDAQSSCLSKIREDHGIKDLDVEVVLTTVMKMTRSFTKREGVIYSFNHRTDQEYFASRHVLHLLETSTNSLREILQSGTQTSQASSEEEEKLCNAILPKIEQLQEEMILQFVEQPLNPGDNVFEAFAPALARFFLTSATINEELTAASMSDEAEIMANAPNLIQMLMNKLSPTIIQTMFPMNSYEAAEHANLLRRNLPNILQSLENVVIPQAVRSMTSYLPEGMENTIETQLSSLINSIISKISFSLPSMNPFVEVLQYVIRDLSAHNRTRLESRWSEIKEVLEEIGANFSTWRDMVLNSPRDTWLVKSAALAAIKNNSDWKILSGRDISAAALMLRYAQPLLLDMHLEPSDIVNQDRWTQVIQCREGNLKLHLHGNRCWDDCVALLLNSKCRLVHFQGKVETSSSLEVLASVACDDAVLQVSVPAPLNFCSLENKCNVLWVSSPLQESDVRGESDSVLPSLPRPRLIIDDIPSESGMKVVQTISTFAPLGNRYELLRLRSCELTDSELDQVVVALQQRGVRTADDGRSGWAELNENYYSLSITDALPKLTTYKLVDQARSSTAKY